MVGIISSPPMAVSPQPFVDAVPHVFLMARGLAVWRPVTHYLSQITPYPGGWRSLVAAIRPGGSHAEVGMPVYVFRCVKCGAKFEKTMTVAQREKAKPACPKCKGRRVDPVLGGFFAKTSRKS
jgi:putative FmdB family regulatory protein